MTDDPTATTTSPVLDSTGVLNQGPSLIYCSDSQLALPNEIVQHILSYLSLQDLLTGVTRVNKHFSQLAAPLKPLLAKAQLTQELSHPHAANFFTKGLLWRCLLTHAFTIEIPTQLHRMTEPDFLDGRQWKPDEPQLNTVADVVAEYLNTVFVMGLRPYARLIRQSFLEYAKTFSGPQNARLTGRIVHLSQLMSPIAVRWDVRLPSAEEYTPDRLSYLPAYPAFERAVAALIECELIRLAKEAQTLLSDTTHPVTDANAKDSHWQTMIELPHLVPSKAVYLDLARFIAHCQRLEHIMTLLLFNKKFEDLSVIDKVSQGILRLPEPLWQQWLTGEDLSALNASNQKNPGVIEIVVCLLRDWLFVTKALKTETDEQKKLDLKTQQATLDRWLNKLEKKQWPLFLKQVFTVDIPCSFYFQKAFQAGQTHVTEYVVEVLLSNQLLVILDTLYTGLKRANPGPSQSSPKRFPSLQACVDQNPNHMRTLDVVSLWILLNPEFQALEALLTAPPMAIQAMLTREEHRLEGWVIAYFFFLSKACRLLREAVHESYFNELTRYLTSQQTLLQNTFSWLTRYEKRLHEYYLDYFHNKLIDTQLTLQPERMTNVVLKEEKYLIALLDRPYLYEKLHLTDWQRLLEQYYFKETSTEPKAIVVHSVHHNNPLTTTLTLRERLLNTAQGVVIRAEEEQSLDEDPTWKQRAEAHALFQKVKRKPVVEEKPMAQTPTREESAIPITPDKTQIQLPQPNETNTKSSYQTIQTILNNTFLIELRCRIRSPVTAKNKSTPSINTQTKTASHANQHAFAALLLLLGLGLCFTGVGALLNCFVVPTLVALILTGGGASMALGGMALLNHRHETTNSQLTARVSIPQDEWEQAFDREKALQHFPSLLHMRTLPNLISNQGQNNNKAKESLLDKQASQETPHSFSLKNN